MIYIFIFAFGVVIGSFLNVVICRYNTGESIIRTGSRCFSCGKKLSWLELIPIFSFLIQRGKCRQCKSRISWQYPIVEFITGLLFLAAFWKFFPDIPAVIFYWLIFSLLIIISVYDLYHQIIPNKFVYPLIILSSLNLLGIWNLGFVWNLEIGNWKFAERILTGLGFFSFFALLWLVSKGKWMGLGDAKIALAAGWLLGPSKGLIAAVFSFWIGALASIFLLLFSSKNFTLKSRVPFGPFLGLGMAIAILFGSEISQFYFNFKNLWI